MRGSRDPLKIGVHKRESVEWFGLSHTVQHSIHSSDSGEVVFFSALSPPFFPPFLSNIFWYKAILLCKVWCMSHAPIGWL